MKFTDEEWLALSRLLDEALALSPDARHAWLEGLPPTAANLKSTLCELLARYGDAETNDFLKTLPKLGRPRGATPSSSGALPGDVVGPYRLLRELGHGGMGSVWLAERTDGVLKRAVALKLPHPGMHGVELAQRFGRERDILAALTHPHISRLYDAGVTAEGQPFLALECVDGQPLAAYCDAHRLDLPRRLALFLQVLDAVQYAHAHLVVHRDLKPSNVLVTPEGQVRLLDFGIAKLIAEEPAPESDLTQAAGPLLTPDYASPEQISCAPLTTATDIYSLGVMLYELLAGERPYRLKRESRGALEEAILEAEVLRPSAACRDPAKAALRGLPLAKLQKALRGDLDTIILTALKKNPAERYASVTAFADDIRRCLANEPVSAPPQFALDRISCLLDGSQVARDANDPLRAIDRAREAQALLPRVRYPSPVLEMRVTMDLGESYRMARQFPAALETFESTYQQLVALGRENTESAGTLYNNWALTLSMMGRPLKAEELFRRAMRISSADGTDKHVSPMLLTNLSRTLLDLEHNAEGARDAELAYARARAEGDKIVVAQSLQMRARAYRILGQYSRADRALTEAEPLLRQLGGDVGVAALDSERALLAQARGDSPSAVANMNEAVRLAQRIDGYRDIVPYYLLRRAELELSLNRFDSALADADNTLQTYAQLGIIAAPSSNLGRAYLVEGRALQALGHTEEARHAISSALEQLRPSLGQDHPLTVLAERLLTSTGTSAAAPR